LIVVVGIRPALILAGAWLPILVVIAARAVGRADDHAVVHVRELRLLRSIPMFESLSPPTIERLAAILVRSRAAAGTWLVRQGERGDRYFVVDTGRADVEIDGRVVRTLEPGDGFGEIALLR